MNSILSVIRNFIIKIKELFDDVDNFIQEAKLDCRENIKEIEFPFTTKIYESRKEKLMTRFYNAYFLFIEQMITDQRFNRDVDLT